MRNLVVLHHPRPGNRVHTTVSRILRTWQPSLRQLKHNAHEADFITSFRFYSSPPPPPASIELPNDEIPHVTIIRPCKGLEPQLYECLASTFHQTYPLNKTHISLCISSKSDAAYPTLRRLLADFPKHDATIYIEDEDPNLIAGNTNLGPNPKIRNMSRAYREAKGDLIWIIDCNVWVSRGVCGRMVDNLLGITATGRTTPYKLVHQLPLVVDGVGASLAEEARGDLSSSTSAPPSRPNTPESKPLLWENKKQGLWRKAGGRLEEQFTACAHDKFYTAINTVAVAPCIVGKSNMFRKSHLDALTTNSASYSPGIDYFSHNICEDHLIGDLLWRKKVPEELGMGAVRYGNHKLVLADVCIQPMARTSLGAYMARRVRWLRVRKYTVTLATFVEPGVESLLCCLYAAFALTHLPFFTAIGVPNSWIAGVAYWVAGVLSWMALDFVTTNLLHNMKSVELDEETPNFARPPSGGRRRPFGQWVAAWLGREVLALPIWLWACYGGASVNWRGRWFWVGMDMRVHEIKEKSKGGEANLEDVTKN